jgi:hypothetical protein
MARQAGNLLYVLGIQRICQISNGMFFNRMPQAPSQSHARDRIKKVFRKADSAAENRDQLLAVHLLWFNIRPMTRQAQFVGICPEKLRTSSAMRFMTGRTAFPKRRLVKDCLGTLQFCQIAMAFEAHAHRIGTHISGLSRRVRVMAFDAVFLCPRVLDLRALDLADDLSA